jgi:HAD superfamily 5'-nucleotidase-like hydrolase
MFSSAAAQAAADLPADVAATRSNGQHSRDIYRGEIFCNRALNMTRIAAIGFDMDYTLAEYHSEKFETLSANGALQKLVDKLGYPKELLAVKYDHSFFIRGLVVDKTRGNILKLDRHRYVKVALHGFNVMSKQDKSVIYDKMTIAGGSFQEPDYALMDTLFSLPDAFLFSAIVEHKDNYPGSIDQSYATIYKDVRRSVDMCHRDGSIKDIVSSNPEEYIQCDPSMFDMLDNIRASGRKTFLVTNSLADYTETVMAFLHKASGRKAANPNGSWQDAFDVIITGSCKPSFIVDSSRPLYRCDMKTGALENTDGPAPDEEPEEFLKKGKTFQGGNFNHLHELLGLLNGSQLMYCGGSRKTFCYYLKFPTHSARRVLTHPIYPLAYFFCSILGTDHIYSDVIRSKRSLGWRTFVVLPELEKEISILNHPKTRELNSIIAKKRLSRDDLAEWIDRLEMDLVALIKEEWANGSDAVRHGRRASLEKERDSARETLDTMRTEIIVLTQQLEAMFHPIWGQMFKSGPQNSRFAEQIESYACLYAQKATNLSLVAPNFYWRAMADLMPHDRFIDSPMHRLLETRDSRDAKTE